MDITTLSDLSRLDRVFHNVVHAIGRAKIPDLPLMETRKFSVTGGVIKSISDVNDQLIVSLVDEMIYSEASKIFVPAPVITVYASKYEDSRMKPVKHWLLDPEKTEEIAFVIAQFFLGHSHLLNRHYSCENLRETLGLDARRVVDLLK